MLRLISTVIFNGNNRYGKVAANLTVNDPHSGSRCAHLRSDLWALNEVSAVDRLALPSICLVPYIIPPSQAAASDHCRLTWLHFTAIFLFYTDTMHRAVLDKNSQLIASRLLFLLLFCPRGDLNWTGNLRSKKRLNLLFELLTAVCWHFNEKVSWKEEVAERINT